MGYRIVRKPSKSYIVRSGANYYDEDDTTLQNSLGTTEQDYYGSLVNTVYGLIYIGNDTYLVATEDLEMVGDVGDYNQLQNTDDVIPARYAYGDQNGYVIGRGSELDGNYENGGFTVGSGRVVIQGVEIDIDNNGMLATLDTASETRYYKIYLKVNFKRNLNLYNAVLESYYSTVSYDEITDPTSGELINNETFYLELYRLELNGNTQVNKIKIVAPISYTNRKLFWHGNVNIGAVNRDTPLYQIAELSLTENITLEIHGYDRPGGSQNCWPFVVYLDIIEQDIIPDYMRANSETHYTYNNSFETISNENFFRTGIVDFKYYSPTGILFGRGFERIHNLNRNEVTFVDKSNKIYVTDIYGIRR